MAIPDETIHIPPSRREFCSRACQFMSVAAIGGVVAACGGGGSPTSPSGGLGSSLSVLTGTRTSSGVTVTVDAGGPLGSTGGMAIVQASGGDLLVTRTGQDTFVALTAQCTHQACIVSAYSGSTYICPCHGSEFDTTGKVVRGPANAPLRQYAAQVANNVLTISA